MQYFKNHYMEEAIKYAKIAASLGEVPVGAVVVLNHDIISASHNEVIIRNDPTAHAEILAIRKASSFLSSFYLAECDLYTTLEPCPMCAHGISLSRIKKLFFGSYDSKSGGVDSGPRIFHSTSAHHIPEVYGGFYKEESAAILKDFFLKHRTLKN